MEMYKYYPSIIFKEDNQNKFSFEPVALSDFVKAIKDINPNKSSTKEFLLLKCLKQVQMLLLIYYKNL